MIEMVSRWGKYSALLITFLFITYAVFINAALAALGAGFGAPGLWSSATTRVDFHSTAL